LITNFVVDINDTLITSDQNGGGTYTSVYTLDIDGNNVADITITVACYLGGQGSEKEIRLSSSDSCMFSVNNSIIDTVGHFDSLGQVIYLPQTFTMVWKYDLHDTIFLNDCLIQNNTFISNYSTGNFPSYIVYNSLDNWFSGDHYIGIRKKINNINYLGWIKATVLDYKNIIIKEFSLNTNLLNVRRFEKHQISIFPNPASNNIYIESPEGQNLNLSVYNIVGECLLQKAFISSKETIDIRNFPSGIYIIKVSNTDWSVQRKLIKE
jgi:hypothetical protein